MCKIYLTIRGHGYPLLLLSGFGFSQRIWYTLIPELEKKFTIYAVDLPGFGATANMCFDDFAAHLMPLLPKQIAVIGWSMGGLVATRLVLDFPERFSYLIHIASSPHFIAQNDWPGISQTRIESFTYNLLINKKKTCLTLVDSGLSKKDNPSINSAIQYNRWGLLNGLDVLRHWDFRNQLQDIKQPTAYLFGQHDRIVPISTLSALQKICPHFVYEKMLEAGHTPFLSHPHTVFNFISNLIRR